MRGTPSRPLASEQIQAALWLFGRSALWRIEDAALEQLKERFPGFDEASTLLKTIAVDSLFGANVFGATRTAQHVSSILAETNIESAGRELVEQLASPVPGARPPRTQLSFASKFAHLFIDPERFPILDSYAERMVRYHVGGVPVQGPKHRYIAFADGFDKLRRKAWDGECRALDRYLWLAGLYHRWMGDRSAPVNQEARSLFRSKDPETRTRLDLLAGRA